MKKTLIITILLFNVSVLANNLNNFSTDGCSLFIDKDYLTNESWAHCCIKHDMSYFTGGVKKEKNDSDLELQQCIEDLGGIKNKYLAQSVFLAVQIFGGPEIKSWFRWGYGWEINRKYQKLSKEQKELVKSKLESISPYDLELIKWPFQK